MTMPHIRTRFMTPMLALILGESVSMLAQDARHIEELANDVRQSPVVFDGETLFSIRGVTAYPAERRAREIAGRIRDCCSQPKHRSRFLDSRRTPQADSHCCRRPAYYGGTEEDGTLEETSRERLAELYRHRISEAIEEYRRERRPTYLAGI